MYSLLKNINNNNNSENIFSLKSDLMKNESVDNKKEQLEKEYKKYALFIPSLVSINGDIVLSWITTRVLFSEDKWVKVSYVFIKNFTFEQKEVYKIIRREDQIGNDFQVIKKGKEYMLIEKISDLSVSFIYSLLSKENSQMNENSNNDKKNKDIFLDWQENPNYESLHSYDPIEENVEKNLNIFRFPSALVIDGKWVSRDTKKNYPFTICFSYPYATCIFQEYLFAISDKKNNSSKIDIKKNNDKVSLEKKVE